MKNRRVILIGFDGGILRTVEHFIDDLPNFRRLIKEGVSCEARPSIPAGTPINWTTIATGAYSSTHGIFGFHNDTGITHGKEPLVELAETFGSGLNKAEYTWETAERSGKKTILINYPTAWPWTIRNSIAAGGCGVSSDLWKISGPAMYTTNGKGSHEITLKKISGTSTQDDLPVIESFIPILSGKNYGWTLHGRVDADKESETPGFNDFLVHPAFESNPTTKVILSGNGDFIHYMRITGSGKKGYDRVSIFRNREDEKPFVELVHGRWTGPVYDTFPTEAGDVEGFYYLKLHELSPDGKRVRICRSNITLSEGYTYPAEIAGTLKNGNCPLQGGLENASTVKKIEYYFDGDWKDLYLIPELYRLQADKIADASRYLLNNHPWDISMIQACMPDGLNHTLGAYLHPDAGKYTDIVNIERAMDIFLQAYRAMDRMLGRIWKECAGPEDIIAVVSDHGSVGSWRYACLQGYLIDGGFMKLKAVDSPAFGKRYRVDMENSKVFLSEHLHVNLRGRYPSGIVEPGEYEKVRNELIEYLESFKDPETGEKVLSHVLKKEEAGYLGIDCDYVGDVVFFLKPGYYPAVVKINFFTPAEYEMMRAKEKITTKPGATHPYHPDMPLGIMSTNAMFFMAGPGVKKGYRKKESIHLADVAPTIAHLAGIERPAQADERLSANFLKECPVKKSLSLPISRHVKIGYNGFMVPHDYKIESLWQFEIRSINKYIVETVDMQHSN